MRSPTTRTPRKTFRRRQSNARLVGVVVMPGEAQHRHLDVKLPYRTRTRVTTNRTTPPTAPHSAAKLGRERRSGGHRTMLPMHPTFPHAPRNVQPSVRLQEVCGAVSNRPHRRPGTMQI